MEDWNKEYKIKMEYQGYNKKSKQFDDPVISKMEQTQGISGLFFIISSTDNEYPKLLPQFIEL